VGAKGLAAGALRGGHSLQEVAICWPLRLAIRPVLRFARTEQLQKTATTTKEISTHQPAQTLVDGGGAAPARQWFTSPFARKHCDRPEEIESMRCRLPLNHRLVALSRLLRRRIFLPWPQTFHFRPLAIVGGEPVTLRLRSCSASSPGLLWIFWLVRAWRRGDSVLGAMLAVATVMLLPILNVVVHRFPWKEADRFLVPDTLLPVAVRTGRHAGAAIRSLAVRPFQKKTLVTSAFALVACASAGYGLSTTSRTKRYGGRTRSEPWITAALAGPRPGHGSARRRREVRRCLGSAPHPRVAVQASRHPAGLIGLLELKDRAWQTQRLGVAKRWPGCLGEIRVRY